MRFSSIGQRADGVRLRTGGGRFRAGASRCVLSLAILLATLLAPACSTVPKPNQARPDTSITLPDKNPEPPVIHSLAAPAEAFELLARSVAESCAVCVREMHAEAFELLDSHYRPGTLLTSDTGTRFARTPGSKSELTVVPSNLQTTAPADAPDTLAIPTLTFRYHAAEDHLVGVTETNWTAADVVERIAATPESALLHGVIEIIAFAYGDGTTFRYSPAEHALQIHCKVVEIQPLRP